MAYESVGSVFDTNNNKATKISFIPLIGNEYLQIILEKLIP
jgi:hypothetical protein